MPKIKKINFFLILGLLGFSIAFHLYYFCTKPQISWSEFYFLLSPNQKRALYIRSTCPSDIKPYTEIFIFDTKIYPELKKPDASMKRRQINNPSAAFLLPLRLSARSLSINWSLDDKSVLLKQTNISNLPEIIYRLNLENYSLMRL